MPISLSEVRDYVESIVYDPRNQRVRARFIPSPECGPTRNLAK